MAGLEELAERLKEARRAPFLFVGAGLSRRYVQTDGWIDLLRRMSAMTEKPYAYYATKANNKAPLVASEIAQNFHEVWWAEDQFSDSRDEFGERLTTSEGPLKVEVARYTREALENLNKAGEQEERELNLLRNAVIDGAITTNYDELLEHVFPEFRTYVGQDGLLFSDTQGIGEIYKIHGSVTDPESLVLTASDYERFGQRNPYLAAKLLTIFVEHPVLFLGYSLNDDDVTEILVSVAKVLTTENLSKLQGRLIFVQWNRTATQSTLVATQIAASGFTIPVIQLTVPDFEGLFTVLADLHRKFPAQLLRQLKEHVYELVMSSHPETQMTVLDIEDATNAKDLEVVFGIGLSKRLGGRGYVGLARQDLLLDVLAPTSAYEPARVVDEALPNLVRGRTHIPIYRYLREAGRLRDDGTLVPGVAVDARVAARVKLKRDTCQPASQSRRKARRLVKESESSFGSLAKQNTLADTLLGLLVMPDDGIKLEELRQYLFNNRDAFDGPQGSAWSKAVCLYDYLRFAVIPSKSPRKRA